jgi:ATP-dependent helicase/nuclease subunit A
MAPAIGALSRLILSFYKEMTKAKHRYKSLDFSDLMHYTLKALEDENTRNEEKERYQFIFVDEYQDTNQLQETLLNYISNGENLFCVGDVKQSIYSFRQAEPALFINRMDKSSTTFKGCDHLIPLSENFRSSNAVVDFINIVFDKTMTRKTGGIDYVGSELLKCRARRPEGEDENAKVELTIINAEEKNPNDELSNIEYEAIVAADIIEDVMKKPIYDGKRGTYRTAKYSDICLLSRSFRPIVRPVRRILEQRGIPITPLGQNGYLDELEIKTTFDILRIIDNHHRDVSLISAMHSPAFGFEIPELVAIRKKYSKKNMPFYKAVEMYISEEMDELSTKLSQFFDTVDRYRMMSRHMQLGEFIWHVLSDTMLYDAVGALPGGRIRQQNLRILAERADAFSMTPGRNLSTFLEYISNMVDVDSDFEPAGDTEANDTVKFMSIHKSKGLEFPVVILLNTASSGKPNNSSVIMSGGLVPGVKCYDPETMTRTGTLSHDAAKSNDSFIENAERLRILYVALTRARERLCILGTIGTGFEKRMQSWTLPKQGELLFGKPFLDIIANSAIRIKGNSIFPELGEYTALNFYTNIINAKDLSHSKQRRKGAVLSAMERAKSTPYVEDAFEFSYKKESFIPAKTSATSLLSGMPTQYQDIEFLETPDFMQEILGYDSAARGTFTHTVMQFVGFENDTNGIYQTIDSLIAKNILPNDARDAVDVRAISRFLDSDIAKRIKNAKVIRKEQPFVISQKACDVYMECASQKEVLIQGIIDLCFIEDGEWVIVDYKTNRVTPKNTPKKILEHYKNQLTIYKRALTILTGTNVKEAGIYLLSLDANNAYLTL